MIDNSVPTGDQWYASVVCSTTPVLKDDAAPTGSGKTVLFELAIIRMLQQARTGGRSPKCVYVAPTKVRSSAPQMRMKFNLVQALCSERHRDWEMKFSALGIKCEYAPSYGSVHAIDVLVGCELTGDTVQFGRSAWGEAKDASIMYDVFDLNFWSCSEMSTLVQQCHDGREVGQPHP